jgi:hypothetical protein
MSNEGYKTFGDENFIAGDGFVSDDFYTGVNKAPKASDEEIEKVKDAGSGGGMLLALAMIPLVFMLGLAGIVGSVDRGEGAGNVGAIAVFFVMMIGMAALLGGARKSRDRLADRYTRR